MFIGTVALTVPMMPRSMASAADAPPRVFLLDPARVGAIRQQIRANDPAVAEAWRALRAEADKALTAGPFSVVDKAVTPPSGDKHDYTSQAPYFWPDPKSPNGLPYVRRDGERNPELDKISDHRTLDGMANSVHTLALAYYLSPPSPPRGFGETGPPSAPGGSGEPGADERYAAKAASLLRAWFLDPATRMNPNLEYAQFIPGVNTGRGIGLIETRAFTRVVDAVGLLESSRAWTADDDRALKTWFARFVAWMQESRNGRDESAAKNNHGTYYDLQLVSYALLLDRRDLARETLERAKEKRIAVQIEPDGRQPLELARTNAWGYSGGNLDGLTQLATLGDRVGVDLWHYRTADGRSIRAAILYLAPYAFGPREKWPHQQIGGWSPATMFNVIRRAAPHYKEDAEFAAVAAKVPPAPDTVFRF